MEVLDNIPEKDLRLASSHFFSDEYKNTVFTIWYNKNKPKLRLLMAEIPNPETNFGVKPNKATVLSWINSDIWQQRARELDEGVRSEVNAALVMTKVEMLTRHIEVAQRMQSLGLEYLESHKNDITAPAAARLIVEGIRIESDSLGVSGMLKKVMRMSSDELKEELVKMMEDSSIIEEEFIDE